MATAIRVLTLNNIAKIGLERLPAPVYEVGAKITDPDAILVQIGRAHV